MQQWRQVGRLVLGAEEEDDDLWECRYLTTLLKSLTVEFLHSQIFSSFFPPIH